MYIDRTGFEPCRILPARFCCSSKPARGYCFSFTKRKKISIASVARIGYVLFPYLKKCYGIIHIAGWSSPVARQAHNLKVVSSNLAPATNLFNDLSQKCFFKKILIATILLLSGQKLVPTPTIPRDKNLLRRS